MIKVENVTVKYGQFTAVDNISFDVQQGEIVAFLGPNGAGKTTTMRVLTGFFAPQSGEVTIDGMNLFENLEKVKSITGYLPEHPPLYHELTVSEYLAFVGEIKGMQLNKLSQRVDEVIELTGLSDRRNTLIGSLSKGLRQRVGIAQSIINYPKVLILDEPTVGLDPKQVVDIRSLIRQLAKAENRTILISTHLLSEASEICEKAIIINEGKIVTSDTIENLQRANMGEFLITLRVMRNREALITALSSINNVESVSEKDGALQVLAIQDVREEIARTAVEMNAGLIELQLKTLTLEEIFMKLTK